MSKLDNYFQEIEQKTKKAYEIAEKARKKGYDPEDRVEIPIAKDMAERVEGLISTVAPQVKGSGVSKRIRELEKKYGVLDWRVSLTIADEIAKQKFCKFESKLEAMEVGVRVGFSYHTLGTVSSPLEGFVGIKIKKTQKGEDYFAIQMAGPIRSAGGTGASVAVLLVDYVREKMGYAVYDPTEEEIKRVSTELYDYHERITNLQYLPSKEEIEFLVGKLPVQIDGDPSEKIEVSNYKDLKRVETKQIRNGVCLTVGEGLAQKAPKIVKQLTKWGKDFGMERWSFMNEFVKLQKEIKAKSSNGGAQKEDKNENTKVLPDYTFIKDMVGGRPIFTYPLRTGGFRLRYGRSRTSGFSSYSVHPSTMFILRDYLAVGTQLKNERPGKGCTVTVCDTIEGPTVLLEDGSVVTLNNPKKAKEVASQIKEIIFLGDILINYGDFFNRAHTLIPPGYCEEWWALEVEKAIVSMFGSLDFNKSGEETTLSEERLSELLKMPLINKPSFIESKQLAEKLNVPLHPAYSYYWKTISTEEFKEFLTWLKRAKMERAENKITKIIILKGKGKRVLEILGVPHLFFNNEFVIIEKDHAAALFYSLNIKEIDDIDKIEKMICAEEKKAVLEIVNCFSPARIRDKAGIFIGARMGRPEKAKIRQLTGSPHVLFPVGSEGGRLRSFQSALDEGKISSDFPVYICEKCEREDVFPRCIICGEKTKKMKCCSNGELTQKEMCNPNEEAREYRQKDLDIKLYLDAIKKHLGLFVIPDLVKGVRGTSNKDHTPEHLAKGILRAKHNIYVNKDGTIRYDMTQLGITHFKPKEIKTSVEKLREIGYTKDVFGKELENSNQVLELKPQDIILPACYGSPDEGADKILTRTARFIDDLLVNFYKGKPYYNVKNELDLVGHLVIALAPHTSAAIVGRIIGFSDTQGFFAHPIYHAAQRRDLDGDESCVMLLLDALINFSRKYLPAHRGSTQDAPLVLTSQLIPTEVDDMVFDMDIVWKYPLEFYEACMEYKKPWDIKIEIVNDRLGKEDPYLAYGFTHDTTNINKGVMCSAYKTLPSMEEKLEGQMKIGELIRAVDESDVARLVIEKHFMKDIKGNLRKFSMQQFRCVACNAKYRRPPLKGICTACGGKIIFTISEGSIVKYFWPSMQLAEKYNVPSYLKQSLEIVKRRIEGVFGKEKEKQEGLNKWFG